jgi:hypothetical protein
MQPLVDNFDKETATIQKNSLKNLIKTTVAKIKNAFTRTPKSYETISNGLP